MILPADAALNGLGIVFQDGVDQPDAHIVALFQIVLIAVDLIAVVAHRVDAPSIAKPGWNP